MIDATWLVREVGPTTAISLSAAWFFWKKVEAQIRDLKTKLDDCEKDRVITAHKLGKLEGRIEAQEKRQC